MEAFILIEHHELSPRNVSMNPSSLAATTIEYLSHILQPLQFQGAHHMGKAQTHKE